MHTPWAGSDSYNDFGAQYRSGFDSQSIPFDLAAFSARSIIHCASTWPLPHTQQHSILSLWLRDTQVGIALNCFQAISSTHVHPMVRRVIGMRLSSIPSMVMTTCHFANVSKRSHVSSSYTINECFSSVGSNDRCVVPNASVFIDPSNRDDRRLLNDAFNAVSGPSCHLGLFSEFAFALSQIILGNAQDTNAITNVERSRVGHVGSRGLFERRTLPFTWRQDIRKGSNSTFTVAEVRWMVRRLLGEHNPRCHLQLVEIPIQLSQIEPHSARLFSDGRTSTFRMTPPFQGLLV